MGDEYSDILGGDSLPVSRSSSSGLSFTLKSAVTLALLLLGYIIAVRAWEYVLKWREKSYRLGLRRRHGIPDNDHRPFNVAYAAVQRAKEEKEKDAARIRRAELAAASSQEQQHQVAPPEQIRHRPGHQRGVDSSRSGVPFPGRYSSTPFDSYNNMAIPAATQSPSRVTFADGYNTSASPLDVHSELAASPSKRPSRKSLGILKSNDRDEPRKRERGYDDDDDDDEADHAKKTRVEGDELIDGDEEAGWQDSHTLQASGSRGSKRGLGEDDDSELGPSKKQRDKRQRKVSLETPADDMEVDKEEEDHVGDLRSISRGRKRDRAEAGSSLGGDDDDEEQEEGRDAEAEEKARRRKRRNKRRSDAGASSRSRGKKRDRDVEDEAGDSDDGSGRVSRQQSKKKRGKKTLGSDEEKLSDVSMEDSSGISTKGRQIGDQWKSNGVHYKIGPNGQRMRLELVRKERQKFVMPMDSLHPDRKANMAVYVEEWLSEEQYRKAKEEQRLSWQESPKGSTEPETPPATTPVDSPTPARTGKQLLWESTSNTPSTQRQDNPFEAAKSPQPREGRLSLASSVGINPTSRRIASTFRGSPANGAFNGSVAASSPGTGLSDSTNSLCSPRTYKSFSKWEKQDLEARGMVRIREANRKIEEDKASAALLVAMKDKEEREKKEKAQLAALPPPPTVPKITLTPAAEAPKPPAFPGAPSAPKSVAFTSSTKGDESEKAPASSMPSFFGKPSTTPTPAPASIPATAAPSLATNNPAVTPSAAPNPPSFSFGAPAGSGPASTTDKPKSTFGLGFPSSAPANAPAPASSTATPAASSTSAPSFSFGKPANAPNFEQSKDASSAANASGGAPGGSLFARLGGAAPAQNTASSGSPAPSSSFFPKPTAPSSSPFGTTPAPASTPAPNQSSQQQQTSSQPAESGSSAPIKFNFFGGKPSTGPGASAFGNTGSTNTNTNSSTTPSSLSGALNPVSTPKAPSPLTFGNSKPAAAEGQPASNPSTGSKFSFGTPSTGTAPAASGTLVGGSGNEAGARPALSIFGASSAKPASSSAATPSPFGSFGAGSTNGSAPASLNNNANAPKSMFGGGGNASGGSVFGSSPATPSAFGGASSGTTTSAFGGAPSGSNNVFGAVGSQNNSVFGAKPATPASSSPFGKPSTEGQNATLTASKPVGFGFGIPSSASTPSAAPAPTTTTSAFGNFGGGGASAFGAAAKPAGEGQTKPTFSFGNGAASSPAPSTSTSTPAGDASKPTFSFSGTTTPAASPAKTGFTFGTPAPAGGANGAPSSGFGAFGSSSSSSPNPFLAFGSKPAGSEQGSK